MREVIGLVSVTLVLSALPAHAQVRPDFSGTWVPAEPKGSPSCSGSFTIRQGPAGLTRESSGNPGRARTYKFDGTETRETFPAASAPASSRGSTTQTTAMVVRTAWYGDRFVMVTHVSAKMWWPGNGPGEFDLQNTFKETMYLDAGGRLVVEHRVIQDPYPGGTPVFFELPFPDSFTCTYTKAG